MTENRKIAIIIGAQKCGTTTLYFSLSHHPFISSPIDPISKRFKKEIDYFYEEENWGKGNEWYFSHFPDKRGISLDSSPNYLTSPVCYERIGETFPHAKIIICLRNPAHRAYSQYNHYCQDMPASKNWDWVYDKDFVGNLKHEIQLQKKPKNDFTGLLLKGAYIKQIQLLLRFFDRSQLYITIMDKWHCNYSQELENIVNFLELQRAILPSVVRHFRKYTVEACENEAKNILDNYYRPLNQELFDFLGYEISEWNTT